MPDHRIEITEHIPRWDTQHLYPLINQPGVARDIPLRPVAHIVRDPIHLDSQSRFKAEEVDHIIPGGMLTPKF